MCGITGVFGNPEAASLAKRSLELMQHRGRDGFGLMTEVGRSYSTEISTLKTPKGSSCMGHCLHSVVGNVMQPIAAEGALVANCEIYNWKNLGLRGAANDAEALLRLLEKGVRTALRQIDGDYAFAFWKGKKLILARDLFGIKPLFYSLDTGFAFASERQALLALGCRTVHELNPRRLLSYDLTRKMLSFTERPFFSTEPELRQPEQVIRRRLSALLRAAVEKRLTDRKLGILFSGGIDSALLALICRKLGQDFTCYAAVVDEHGLAPPEDLHYSELAAGLLGLRLKTARLRLADVEKCIPIVVRTIEDRNATKVGVGIVFHAACSLAAQDGVKVIFSGLGSEELFAGYERHRTAASINRECLSGLLSMYERDTYRDDTITMALGMELRVPFLDKELAEYSLRIPGGLKLREGMGKHILRLVAEDMGLPPEFAWRPKRAAQYGSRSHRALQRLARDSGKRLVSEYLAGFPARPVRLAALVSGGKDSIYALYVMKRQNYDIPCLVSMRSDNPDSYMFHTPALNMVRLQAESLGIPLLEQRTGGLKEHELDDLAAALKKAKHRFGIEGVVSGALRSSYQRDRLQRVCESLELKLYSPLWGMDEQKLMQQLMQEGFRFMLTSVACDGLGRGWLGRPLCHDDLRKLIALSARNRMNLAGEGGEYESLVLDMPLFRKRLYIDNASISMESPCTGRLSISRAHLEGKMKKRRQPEDIEDVAEFDEDSDHPVREKTTKEKPVLK